MAVVDSSAFIPLLNAGKLDILFKCFKGRVAVPAKVWEEVVEEGNRLGKNVSALEAKKKELKILSIGRNELLKIQGLERNDLEVLSVAQKQMDILITNDATLHDAAVAQNVKVWWLTALVLHAAKIGVISEQEGKSTLLELVSAGAYLKSEILAQALLLIDRLKKNEGK